MLGQLFGYGLAVFIRQLVAGNTRPANPLVAFLVNVRRQAGRQPAHARVKMQLSVFFVDANGQAVRYDYYLWHVLVGSITKYCRQRL